MNYITFKYSEFLKQKEFFSFKIFFPCLKSSKWIWVSLFLHIYIFIYFLLFREK